MRDLNAQLTRNSISESGDKIIRVWDIHTGELLEMLEAHDRGIASIAFEPPSPYSTWKSKMSGTKLEGTIVTGSSDASIKTSHLVEDPKVPSGGTMLIPPPEFVAKQMAHMSGEKQYDPQCQDTRAKLTKLVYVYDVI